MFNFVLDMSLFKTLVGTCKIFGKIIGRYQLIRLRRCMYNFTKRKKI